MKFNFVFFFTMFGHLNANPCNKLFRLQEGYECQCCTGFAGSHCEEIDACSPSPCTNNGICVDLSQGHEGNSYQCLCPYGMWQLYFAIYYMN